MYVSLSVLQMTLSRCVHGAGFDACIILSGIDKAPFTVLFLLVKNYVQVKRLWNYKLQRRIQDSCRA